MPDELGCSLRVHAGYSVSLRQSSMPLFRSEEGGWLTVNCSLVCIVCIAQHDTGSLTNNPFACLACFFHCCRSDSSMRAGRFCWWGTRPAPEWPARYARTLLVWENRRKGKGMGGGGGGGRGSLRARVHKKKQSRGKSGGGGAPPPAPRAGRPPPPARPRPAPPPPPPPPQSTVDVHGCTQRYVASIDAAPGHA